MNLIFDTNYILHKNVHTLNKMGSLYSDFHTLMNNNLNHIIEMNNWDNIFIVSDSKKKSWRQLNLDNHYKENRVKNPDIDWKWVYNEYNEFKEDLKEKYVVLERDHIEGDDWITALVLKANSLHQSNVVISSDQDLLQLVKYSLKKDKPYINMQIDDKSGKERLFIPIGWEIWLKEFDEKRGNDVFDLNNGYHDISFFNRIHTMYEPIEVNRHEKLFKKFVMGDKGDNVPCPYRTLTKTGKERGIGKAGAQKIWKHYSESYADYFDTGDEMFAKNVVTSIERVNNIELNENRFDSVVENVKTNIKLMELHYKNYPDWVLETIINDIEDLF